MLCISAVSVVTSPFSFRILLIWVLSLFFLMSLANGFNFVYLLKEATFSFIDLCYCFLCLYILEDSCSARKLTFWNFFYAEQTVWFKQHLILYFIFSYQGPYVTANQLLTSRRQQCWHTRLYHVSQKQEKFIFWLSSVALLQVSVQLASSF